MVNYSSLLCGIFDDDDDDGGGGGDGVVGVLFLLWLTLLG